MAISTRRWQTDNLPSVENTTERIAKENNVSSSFVIRAEQFMKTVELMEKYCPGIQEEILSGKLKLSQREATIIRGTPTEALPTVVSTWREEKLNGKPDDSADTYENSELLSKVTERNFSSAATSKIQTADPLSENRPFISSGKRSTELQTIRELGEKMATVDHVADAEGMFSEINSASDSFIFRLEHCFALYPDFLTSKSYCCFAKGRKLYCASERTASAASSGDYQQPVKCFPKICLMKKHWR